MDVAQNTSEEPRPRRRSARIPETRDHSLAGWVSLQKLKATMHVLRGVERVVVFVQRKLIRFRRRVYASQAHRVPDPVREPVSSAASSEAATQTTAAQPSPVVDRARPPDDHVYAKDHDQEGLAKALRLGKRSPGLDHLL